ncbi:MAG: hypothetical protein DCC67_11565 [Planctomycetota bacterium]|nr:MAG: hypothetical protein DCC67_11565 [Planctomycetota bacterium]
MERRNFILFLVLSFLVLTANQIFIASRRPPQPPPGQQAEAPEDAPADDAQAQPDERRPVAPAIKGAEDEGPDQQAVAAEAAEDPELPEQIVTLGSVDETGDYRMLVTLTNRGAAVRRIELASSRFSDLHDRSGYLGHLELVAEVAGLRVRAVGAGTPADKAGLRPGDVIVEAGRDAPAPVKTLEAFGAALEQTRPRQTFHLVVQRDGQRRTFEPLLERRPLELVRPEAENVLLYAGKLPEGFTAPPSFLMALEAVDGQQRPPTAEAIPGVDLDTSNWRLTAPADGRPADAVTFERRLPHWGLVATKTYRLRKRTAPPADGKPAEAAVAEPAYDLTLEIGLRNESDAAHTVSYRLDGPNGLPIEGWWYATKIGRTSSAMGLRDVVGRYFAGEPQQLGAPAIASGDVEDFEGSGLAYMGVDAQYFCVALVPQVESPEASWIPRSSSIVAGTPPNLSRGEGRFANVTCRLFTKSMELPPGEGVQHVYTVFAGPKRPELLAQYQAADLQAYSLSDFVYYGWFGAVARLMLGLLHAFYSVVQNYGVAIIMLTVLVRGFMFPISRRQAKSMAKLQELRPEMERIKEKYKGDQQKQAHAMQELYRKHNVNPLAGCLPMLIQLPVFIGLYRGLAVDVELRQAPLLSENIRWCSNLAAPDMLLDWSGFMPRLITSGEGFFGLGPYLNILPLVTIGLFLLQQKMFMPEPTNEQAALQQKIMTYMMIFMGLLFYKVPSGLCIYFIASSLWGIAERKMIGSPTTPEAASGPPAASTGPASAVQRDKAGKKAPGDHPRAKSKRRR